MFTFRIEDKQQPGVPYSIPFYHVGQGDRYSVEEILTTSPEAGGEPFWRTLLTFWKGSDVGTMVFKGKGERVARVYVMNDAGKTIDTI